MENNYLKQYREYLEEEELSQNTIRKYMGDVGSFLKYFSKIPDKRQVIGYKEILQKKYRPNTVNSRLRSLNRFFRWADREDLIVRTERVPRNQGLENVLSREEYQCLLETALETGRRKLFLLMKTLACTGIRIGELPYITYESINIGRNMIHHKGRYREIYLPASLCCILMEYCREQSITEGPVFRGRGTHPLESSGVWRSLKRLAAEAGVEEAKVYPHSFRHLFAKTYMEHYGNIAELADILGHASIETTRIYTLTSSSEKRVKLDHIGL